MVVRHHQRPGGQRHELPGDEEGEGVVGQHDEVHAGEERRIEWQHAPRRFLVLAIADGEQARAAPPRLTTTRKNAVSASMRKCAPIHGNPRGRRIDDAVLPALTKWVSATPKHDKANGKACPVDQARRRRPSHRGRRQQGHAEEGRHAAQDDDTGVTPHLPGYHGRPSATGDSGIKAIATPPAAGRRAPTNTRLRYLRMVRNCR